MNADGERARLKKLRPPQWDGLELSVYTWQMSIRIIRAFALFSEFLTSCFFSGGSSRWYLDNRTTSL